MKEKATDEIAVEAESNSSTDTSSVPSTSSIMYQADVTDAEVAAETAQIGAINEVMSSEQLQNIEGIEKLVVMPTWRDILFDLVKTERFDPWNIDIGAITTAYVERVKKMRALELHIPANIILAAAILLRIKSEMLQLESEEQIVENTIFVEGAPAEPIEMSLLQLRVRVPPKRAITLADVINALEEVITLEKKREAKARELPPSVIELELPQYNIEHEMKEILEKAKNIADTEGWLTFSQLVKEPTPKGIIMSLLPILHLVQEGKMHIVQEKIFGEIFIKIIEKDNIVNTDNTDNTNGKNIHKEVNNNIDSNVNGGHDMDDTNQSKIKGKIIAIANSKKTLKKHEE